MQCSEALGFSLSRNQSGLASISRARPILKAQLLLVGRRSSSLAKCQAEQEEPRLGCISLSLFSLPLACFPWGSVCMSQPERENQTPPSYGFGRYGFGFFGPRTAFPTTGALWGRATPFFYHFSVNLSSVLGRTELCHEVWTPGPQKPQIISNENHHLALFEKREEIIYSPVPPLRPHGARTYEAVGTCRPFRGMSSHCEALTQKSAEKSASQSAGPKPGAVEGAEKKRAPGPAPLKT